ncbi:MAG: hypothetical protein K0R60_264 [Microbacterium sp.]|jgi:hypothetical protein|nr:hypothetical protein [Microbacterium sp.]
MSNPEEPSNPPLTRRQLREIRHTGSTPIVTADAAPVSESAPVEPATTPPPRPAAQAVVPPAPRPDASVDLGVSPLTRRAAREQERIRTASIPVITPDAPAAQTPPPVHAAETAAPAGESVPETQESVLETDDSAPAAAANDEPETATRTIAGLFAAAEDEHPADRTPLLTAEAAREEAEDREPADRDANAEDAGVADAEDAPEPAMIVSPQLGSALLEGSVPRVELPPSFDHLLTRDSSATGSVMAPNALILSQTPATGSLTSPIAATGEILITGTFELPEGLGSRGHAPGTTDGKEADAVLVDGELPAHSSPTPIAASAAISTVRSADEIIRPPAPEKGSRLMLTLAITAGALALALVGLLIAVTTGVIA